MYPSDDGYVRAETIQQAARSHVQRAIVTPAEIKLCPELADFIDLVGVGRLRVAKQ